MFTIILAAFSLVGAVIHLAFTRISRTPLKIVEIFLIWTFFFLGAGGILAFLGHVFNADAVARSIGWPPGNPFQFEVGVANLGMGLLGIISMWRKDFWLPTIIMASAFLLGAAYGHIDQIIRFQNYSPNNAGPILYADIWNPLLLIALYISHRVLSRKQAEKGTRAQAREPRKAA